MTITLFGQTINNSRWNFSDFQVKTAQELEAQPNFKEHVTTNMTSHMEGFHRNPQPWSMLWYDTNGKLHLWRVGVNRMLQQVVAGSWADTK